ncbi:Serine/threonine-protein kinase [Wickerhamomyces ciferrii]|uniref:Serine/threonine-protein kinase n=1 Tax=Wickerhamomyces ciferrii (strain ATCC 14091 / BCRC 22168 / CBS 111 / JCM 3599 / NBRC 0793 / NRRL Y-1031 F-60-10) TaxID=1206466 RepID=K0KKB8_WICCF|nr:Serine/threonine-protein kinase [Wickerhamomyces ciferrii]CCH41568.1 Serine/threonine-protein kinase [Wickerhamomyces ciferrii]
MSLSKSGLHVYVDQNDGNSSSGNEDGDGNLVMNIPENQGLLPPLPDIDEIAVNNQNNNQNNGNSAIVYDDNNSSFHSRTQSLEQVLTPSSLQRSRTSSNKVTTPTGMMTPKTELNSSQFEIQTPTTQTISKFDINTVTPVREKQLIEQDQLENQTLECSPTITIDERFDVSVDIPNEDKLPKTTEDKIKFFQLFQKREQEEFDKTLSSLKKGGWVSSQDLSSLENKKRNHYKKWGIKINELKNTLKLKQNQKHYENHPEINGYFSPKDIKESDSFNFDGGKSPNLQTLEQKFSVLGITR